MMRPFMWRVALSPAAWIVPLMAVAVGATFGLHWGSAAAVVGMGLGTLLGIGGAVFAYHLLVERGAEQRERELLERLERELTRPKPTRRSAPIGAVDPIALATGSVPPAPMTPIDIDVDAALRGLLRETDVGRALVDAEALVAERPRDGRIAGAYARVLHRADRTGDACRVGSDAIQMCVLGARPAEAVEVLADLWDLREALTFEAGTAVELARVLTENGEVAQARWCVEKAAAEGADSAELSRTRERLSKP